MLGLVFLSACAGTSSPATRFSAGPATRSAETLLGTTSVALTSVLGAPEFVRRDQGAEVWQYSGESCTLLFYLYTPKDGGEPTTSFIDARSKHAGAVPKDVCLAQALERRTAKR